MQWREILELAAHTAGAERQLASIVALLDAALATEPGAQLVRDALGPDDDAEPPFIASLDRACRGRHGRWSARELAAVRAVLRELAPWLGAARNLLYGGNLPSFADDALPAVLARLERAADRVGDAAATSSYRCPRCGARDMAETHTGALGPRFTEVTCRRCGLYANWSDGDDTDRAAAWAGTQ